MPASKPPPFLLYKSIAKSCTIVIFYGMIWLNFRDCRVRQHCIVSFTLGIVHDGCRWRIMLHHAHHASVNRMCLVLQQWHLLDIFYSNTRAWKLVMLFTFDMTRIFPLVLFEQATFLVNISRVIRALVFFFILFYFHFININKSLYKSSLEIK